MYFSYENSQSSQILTVKITKNQCLTFVKYTILKPFSMTVHVAKALKYVLVLI